MRFANILEDILGHKSNIKVLRYLVNSKLALTGRQIARAVGISHSIVNVALKQLASFGITTMQRTGRAIVYKVNDNNAIVKKVLIQIFKVEKNLLSEAIAKLIRGNKIHVASAIVFGSVATSSERGTSDIDVLFLVSSQKDRNNLIRLIEEKEYNFILEYGNMLSPIVLTLGTFHKRLLKGDQLIQNVIHDGKVVYGKTIQEVLIQCQRNK